MNIFSINNIFWEIERFVIAYIYLIACEARFFIAREAWVKTYFKSCLKGDINFLSIYAEFWLIIHFSCWI